ncbi:MAG: hypothetical protein ACRBF0_21920 [Calditrichia bacterium]
MTHSVPIVAVFGGACSGSEAAFQLASRGIHVAVFEQQALPYGKIEDGLPKWHVKLRDKEEGKIDSRLSHPNIHFIPNTRLGGDLDFNDVVHEWGFSAVILASGAWRDRPLPVDGIDEFEESGFYYQNAFVDWFNHNHEPGYSRNTYQATDGAIVVGGGLASIDVVKILMLETTTEALRKRGKLVDVISLEHIGIPAMLEEHGLTFSELNLKGCTLFYRRRSSDMPLASIPDGADEARIEKVRQVRQKILRLAQEKYLFRFQECCKPVAPLAENGRLGGLLFQKTEVVDGRVQSIENSEFKVHAPLTISSIGSIPQPIRGIPSKGELFIVPDHETGRVEGFEHVFAVGNAVTGTGNIRQSELHSRRITTRIIDEYLNWTDSSAAETVPDSTVLEKIRARQHAVGYQNNYQEWTDRHRPVRLEHLLAP